ncbi:BQ5605_C022g09452 [Microbotryum silenes-dioicae]|uniref:BQ5605_C022g09452 protein n=1 Tax=Microbotryum silenes-dioicae TaxID=796604 RepID=A0A2X0PEG9_9BASI|nr:BQ5605_C022g09452 [Microbotryum silenes-dioicae]
MTFWRPDTNTVFVSDDANFDESSFEIQRGESDEAALREDAPTTIFGDAPGGDGRDATPPPVGRAMSPDREHTSAAPGRERASGNGGRVQHSNGQELTPIVPNGRAPASVAGDGRAPPPVASRRPSSFLDDDADNKQPT